MLIECDNDTARATDGKVCDTEKHHAGSEAEPQSDRLEVTRSR
jgi:hypothetical protein